MTSSDVLLLLAAVGAVGDWIAVVTRRPRLEYACKPLTMVFLLGVAAAIDVGDTSVQRWFLLALALSLLGDGVPDAAQLPGLFVPGLLAFLAAHLALIVGMWAGGVSFLGFVIGLAVAGFGRRRGWLFRHLLGARGTSG